MKNRIQKVLQASSLLIFLSSNPIILKNGVSIDFINHWPPLTQTSFPLHPTARLIEDYSQFPLASRPVSFQFRHSSFQVPIPILITILTQNYLSVPVIIGPITSLRFKRLAGASKGSSRLKQTMLLMN